MNTRLNWFVASMIAIVSMARADITPENVMDFSPSEGARFGGAVAIDGDMMVVGAPGTKTFVGGEGAARLYRWNGTRWAFETTLATGPGPADAMGTSVAISGDTAVIGIPFRNVGANSDQGSVYVVSRNGNLWSFVTELKAADGKANDVFGLSVGISGNTIVVGAYGADIGLNNNQGAVYVFTRSGTTWTQAAKLTNPVGAAADRLGYSVAISGEYIVSGAWGDDIGPDIDRGSAQIFARTNGAWQHRTSLLGFGGAGTGFGVSVAIDRGWIAVGSPYQDVGPSNNIDRGTVTVFRPAAPESGYWALEAELKSGDSGPGDRLGWSVGISGREVIAGSPADDVEYLGEPFLQNVGSAFVFAPDPSTGAWGEMRKLASPIISLDQAGFGSAVAISNSLVAVGEPNRDNEDTQEVDAGGIWMYERLGENWMTQPDIVVNLVEDTSTDFGSSVDVDGDYMVVGSRQAGNDKGRADLYRRTPAGWVHAALLGYGAPFGDAYGWDVAISGKIIVVGIVFSDVKGSDSGQIEVFRITGLNSVLSLGKFAASDGQAGDYLGTSVDVEGNWIAAGADYDDGDEGSNQGSVRMFFVDGNTVTPRDTLYASDALPHDHFGHSVEISGTSLVVGAPQDDTGVSDGGSAYIFTLSGSTWSEAKYLLPDIKEADAHFGERVSISGDVAVVSAPNQDSGGLTDSGALHVFEKSYYNWDYPRLLVLPSPVANAHLGMQVSTDGSRVLAGASAIIDDDRDSGAAGVAIFQIQTHASHFARTLRAPDISNIAFPSSLAMSGSYAAVGSPVAGDPTIGLVTVFPVGEASLTGVRDRDYDVMYPSLSMAIREGCCGRRLWLGSPNLWKEPVLDSESRPYGFQVLGAMRMPFGSSLVCTFPSSLGGLNASDETITIGGILRTTGESIISGKTATFGPRSQLLPGAGITFDVEHFRALGTTRLSDDSMTIFAESTVFGGSLTGLAGTNLLVTGSLQFDGNAVFDSGEIAAGNTLVTGFLTAADVNIYAPSLTIAPNGRYVGRGSIYGNVSNYKSMTFNGLSYIIGNLVNGTGATITIQTGTLYFAGGSLTNNGTITGSFCCRAVGGLDVDGRFECGPDAALYMSDGAIVRVTGDADIGITWHDQFTMRHGELRMDGAGAPQTLEAMSSDNGAVSAGLNADIAGNFPLGVLSIRPGAWVTVVDNRDNDGLGLSDPEAVYAEDVVIGSGATLDNSSAIVYYRRLTMNGTVTEPLNLIRIDICDADFDGDGFLTGDDFDLYAAAFELGHTSADFNSDGFVTGDDFDAYVGAFEEGC